jgi:hypothetical protein
MGWEAEVEPRRPELMKVRYERLIKKRNHTICTPP